MLKMKLCSLAVVGLSTTALSLSIARPDQTALDSNDQDLYLIELGPGQERWIAEDEKWALRRVCSYTTSSENKLLAINHRRC